jgi:hypothetical protein
MVLEHQGDHGSQWALPVLFLLLPLLTHNARMRDGKDGNSSRTQIWVALIGMAGIGRSSDC